eukprot:2188237-Rhodomonas_salina.1
MFQIALALNPADAVAHFNLAQLYRSVGNHAQVCARHLPRVWMRAAVAWRILFDRSPSCLGTPANALHPRLRRRRRLRLRLRRS